MNDKQLLKTMRITALIASFLAFLACILVSCKPVHEVSKEYVDRYVHDSVLVERIDTLVLVKEHRDSITLRDSIYVNVWQSADTIYKVREVWKYRDRVSIKHDTIKDVQIDVQYRERVDTAFIEKVQVKTEYVKRGLSFWDILWLCSIGAVVVLLALLTLRTLRK